MIWERQLLVTDKHLITKWMLNRAVFGWVKINSLLWTQTNWKNMWNKCKFYTNKEQTRLKSNKTWTECWSKTFELVSFSEFVQFKNLIFSPKKPQNLFRININIFKSNFVNRTTKSWTSDIRLRPTVHNHDTGRVSLDPLEGGEFVPDLWGGAGSRPVG